MRATAVVEIEMAGQCLPGSGHSFVAVQIDLFILHGFPKPFDENVVSPAAFTISVLMLVRGVIVQHLPHADTRFDCVAQRFIESGSRFVGGKQLKIDFHATELRQRFFRVVNQATPNA